MMSTIGWGIAGAGAAAALFAEGLVDAPGAELVAVASRNPAHAQAFRDRFGARRAHGSYEALARDPDVNVVYVATANSDHHRSALLMLGEGKPVLCEKPFALQAVQARDVIEMARRKRLFCMEAMWMRFIPAVREFVDEVRAGVLGEPCAATIELGHPFVFDPAHRLFDPEGGGALLDLGVYAVSFALLLFGPATGVQSQALLGSSGVDEQVTALLSHTGGRQSMIGASLRTRLSNAASVAGTHAWGTLHEPLYRPSGFTIRAAPRVLLTDQEEPEGLLSRARRIPLLRAAERRLRRTAQPLWRKEVRTVRRPYRGNGYGYEAIETMRCIRAGETESAVMPLDETLRVMETLDAIRRVWKVL